MPDLTLTAAVEAVFTWAAIGVLRLAAPRFWLKLDKRQFRLAVVAAAAVAIAVIGGLIQGLGWLAIAKTAAVAFAGAVTARQTTKMNPPTVEYRTDERASIRSRLG